MRPLAFFFVLLLCPWWLSSGCYLAGDGQELERRVESLEDRHQEFVETFRAERLRLTEVVQRAEQQVLALEQALQEADEVLRRNSADLGASVEDLRGRVNELQGQLTESRARHAELLERVNLMEQLLSVLAE